MSGFNNEQLDNLRKNGWSYHVDNGMTDEQLKQLNKNTEDISQLSSEIASLKTVLDTNISEVAELLGDNA